MAIVDTSVTTTKKILIDELRTALGIATQAQQETGTSVATMVSPGRQQFHPSAAKWWIRFDGTSATAVNASYNNTSLTDNGTGDYTITIATDFSSTAWAPVGMSMDNSAAGNVITMHSAPSEGSIRALTFTSATGVPADSAAVGLVGYGDQA